MLGNLRDPPPHNRDPLYSPVFQRQTPRSSRSFRFFARHCVPMTHTSRPLSQHGTTTTTTTTLNAERHESIHCQWIPTLLFTYTYTYMHTLIKQRHIHPYLPSPSSSTVPCLTPPHTYCCHLYVCTPTRHPAHPHPRPRRSYQPRCHRHHCRPYTLCHMLLHVFSLRAQLPPRH